jgi:hypothetical protein
MTDTAPSTALAMPAETSPTAFSSLMDAANAFDAAMKMAGSIAAAGWAPNSYRKDVPKNHAGARIGRPEDQDLDTNKIAIGIMQGAELGLKPIQSLQSIAVVNGIPSLYGDAMLAVVNATGQVEDFAEEPVVNNEGVVTGWKATMKRKSRATPTVRFFTVEDAKGAGLLNKSGPWTQYRSRMLQMRARGWCLRDSFPDTLKGLMIAEEAQDIVIVTNEPVPAIAAPKSVKGKLKAFTEGNKAPEVQEPVDADFTEDAHDPVTSEVTQEEASGLPNEIQAAFDNAKFTPFLQWLDVELQKLADAPEVKQGLVDRHAARLRTVYASGKAAEAAVNKLVTAFGVELSLEGLEN